MATPTPLVSAPTLPGAPWAPRGVSTTAGSCTIGSTNDISPTEDTTSGDDRLPKRSTKGLIFFHNFFLNANS